MSNDTLTVRRLWDLEQIKQLKARYFRFLDLKDWEAFKDLFTEDCVHHLSPSSARSTATNAEYFHDLPLQLDNSVTVHHGHTPEITFISDTEAEGIWAMSNYAQLETATKGRGTNTHVCGYYYETYRKCDDGVWRISSKRNVNLRRDDVPYPIE
jgi:3-phenylpropionate/cinnamic acid dioxygenase small subunit